MLSHVPPAGLLVRQRPAHGLIHANDNVPRGDATEWWKLWLQLLAIWALPPIVVLASIIAAVVFLWV